MRKKKKLVEFCFGPRDHSLQVSVTLVKESRKDANGLTYKLDLDPDLQLKVSDPHRGLYITRKTIFPPPFRKLVFFPSKSV